MADVFSKQQRSALMAKVKSRGNRSTELRLMQIFREFGITGWRRRFRLFGNPDFVFRKERLAIFVDGCFWHGCPKHYSAPQSNRLFWLRKITKNKRRDKLVRRKLRSAGWIVVRIWQHELRDHRSVASRVRTSLDHDQQ